MISGVNFSGDYLPTKSIVRFGDGGGGGGGRSGNGGNNNRSQRDRTADAYREAAQSMQSAGMRNLSGQDRTNTRTGRSSSTVGSSSKNAQGTSVGTSGRGLGAGFSRSPGGRAGSTNAEGASRSAAANSMRNAGMRNLSGAPARSTPTGMTPDVARSMADAGLRNLGGRGLMPSAAYGDYANSMWDAGLTNLAGGSAGAPRDPFAMGLLDTIAGPESRGRYDVRYPSTKFDGYEDHPREYSTITEGPWKGYKSSAAGRYQFIDDTWDKIADDLGLPDFTPENQDRAAWDLAKKEYDEETGRDLLEDLRSGDPDVIAEVAPALKDQWASLPRGATPAISKQKFAKEFEKNYLTRLDNIGGRTEVEKEVPAGSFLDSDRFAKNDPEAPAIDEEAEIFTSDRFAHSRPDLPGVDDVAIAAHNGNSNLPALAAPQEVAITRAAPVAQQPARTEPAEVVEAEPAQQQQEADKSSKGRGLGGNIAAGAIDVGVGMIPGVGTAATVLNLGAAVTGRRTIGQHAVDLLGDTQPLPDDHFNKDGGFEDRVRTGENEDLPRNTLYANQSTVPAPAQNVAAFEDKYLSFDDGVDRPTPAEKWGRPRQGEI